MTRPGRRPLAYAVLLCLAGAGLALFAATRIWAVEVTLRPAPLPATRVARTGGDLLPWLSALAVVGLAGAGAVLATRHRARRALGGLLLVVGAGVLVGAVAPLVDPPIGGVGAGWPLLCAAGGLALAAGGALTAARGQRWPAMGARYERAAPGRPPAGATGTPGASLPGAPGAAASPGVAASADGPATAGGAGAGGVAGRPLAETWDALDRGEDPTDLGEDPADPGEDPTLSDPDGSRRD